MSIGISILLFLVALITATISGVFGLAGGALFFAVLSWVVSTKEAIPLHSSVQLLSNFSRIIFFFKTVKWKIVSKFLILLLPGAYLGGLLYDFFYPLVLELIVGVFILITIFLPENKNTSSKPYTFVILGFLSGFLGMIVAVTGPFIASFFVLNNITKEEMVSTKAVCQGFTQLIKVLIFSSVIGFDFGNYSYLLLFLGLATILGIFIGKNLIGRINNKAYDQMNNYLLGFVAVSMIFKAGFDFLLLI